MSYKNTGVSRRREKAYYSDELKQRLVAAANQPGVRCRCLLNNGVSVYLHSLNGVGNTSRQKRLLPLRQQIMDYERILHHQG